MNSTTDQEFFEGKYRAVADPWNFAGDAYELARYRAILAALGNRHFRFAVEPGCSVGVLTEMIARHADHVFAFDISPTAVERAVRRCAHLPHVSIMPLRMTEYLPEGAGLLMLSEVGYYFQSAELERLMERYVAWLAPDATVLACHWLGESADHVTHGDEVHATLCKVPGLIHEFEQREVEYRIDRWRKSTR